MLLWNYDGFDKDHKDETHDTDDKMMKCLKKVRESFKIQTIQACLSNASFIWSRLRFNATPQVAIALHRRFEEVDSCRM